MSALPYPTYGLTHLYLFPVYQTREAYREATGLEAPPFDPEKPVKSWFDPTAATSGKRKLIYENVIAYAENGAPLVDSDGKPMLEPLMLDREVAANVNIPPKDILNAVHVPELGTEIPVPLRPLEANEELYFQFGGSVAVKNTVLFGKLNESGFTGEDRALLVAIAEKLGIGQ